MKITDEELIQKVWENQLRKVAGGVLDKYVGGRAGLCSDDQWAFSFASSEHRVSRHNVTSEIGSQQLLVRLRRLFEQGTLHGGKSSGGMLTFHLPGEMAWSAFCDARDFWSEKGVPEGASNGRMNTTDMHPAAIQMHKSNLLMELRRRYPVYEEPPRAKVSA